MNEERIQALAELYRESPAGDPVAADAQIRGLQSALAEALDALQAEHEQRGGESGERLRAALEGAIVEKADRHGWRLHRGAEVISLGATCTPTGVVVDVRLRIGRVTG